MNREDVSKIVSEAHAKGERPDLHGADLSGADLSMANLSDVDLHGADLSWTDLRGAILNMADMTEANMSGADMSGADLRWAEGLLATAKLGRHDAVAAGGYISIGCERHTYDHWLEHAEEIGKANRYTAAEIARYKAWIEMVVPWLKAEEEAKR